jgi:hypothetical protein
MKVVCLGKLELSANPLSFMKYIVDLWTLLAFGVGERLFMPGECLD